ncbi:hypothetical protein N7533_007998 [Penicillium manginii]|uniref:uncharacterized protein n=1 Tax=Penicillium manginii TaxID=203109 RepID=UPI0025484BEB|nr:uncharacterized protein N7533_007998 [Penicillium manginii]KAJ5750970.1 hypothetical protein N7533_007998 [Penicillium manginii]
MAFRSVEHVEYETYEERRLAGAERQKWLSDPSIPCPIPKSTLTFKDIMSEAGWRTDQLGGPHVIPELYQLQAVALGLPLDANYRTKYISRLEEDEEIDIDVGFENWGGITGPGVIILQNIFKTFSLPPILPSGKPSSTIFPYMSRVTQAVYEADFALHDLKHVFVSDVLNVDTRQFVSHHIHHESKQLAEEHKQLLTWEYGTDDYQTLLATRIGKLVVYLILGAFERGTRRIARVATWFHTNELAETRNLQMRFDIEEDV